MVGAGAACALWLACVCAPAANAGQQISTGDASSGSSTQKASTDKAESSSKRRHKAAATSAGKTSSSSPSGKGKRSSSRRSKTARGRGQKKIDSERAQAIQEALIREHYLKGEATGTWNQSSEDAMRQYQSDHGWQSKTVPDSRALIKLGLGPSHDHLLNPESAMTSGPDTHAEATPAPAPPNVTRDPHGDRTPATTAPAPGTQSMPTSNPPQSADSPQ